MLNTFTLHFPNEIVFQSQSSLKWWINSLFVSWSKTCWLWIHSPFISRSKTFSRVTSLPWNNEYIHSSFPERKRSSEPIFSEMMNTFPLHFPIENVLQSTRLSRSTWIFLVFVLVVVFELVAAFQLSVRPAFDFPDWNFFRRRFNLHFDRQFSSDTQSFKPFTCTLAPSIGWFWQTLSGCLASSRSFLYPCSPSRSCRWWIGSPLPPISSQWPLDPGLSKKSLKSARGSPVRTSRTRRRWWRWC